MRVETADGIDIAVHVDGPQDAPVVAFVHGVVLSADNWSFLVDELAARYRVVRLDLRGHGDSDRAPGRYDLGGFVADVEAVLTAVGGADLLVGHSLGGLTAAALAQQRPDLVDAVLLVDPALLTADPLPPDAPPPAGPLIDLFRQLQHGLPAAQASDLTVADYAAVLRDVPTPFDVPAHERYHPDTMTAWASSQLRFDVAVLDRFIAPGPDNLGTGYDVEATIGVPGLVLAADTSAPDRVVGRAMEQRFTTANPQVEFERLDGAGHNLHDELGQRAVFLERLRGMLPPV